MMLPCQRIEDIYENSVPSSDG